MNRKSIGFYIKLHLVKGIVGENGEDSVEIRFGEEFLVVVYRGDTYGGVQ